MKNSSHCSVADYQPDCPRMANSFDRRTRDRLFLFLEAMGTNRNEVCFSPERNARNILAGDES
jgi:hypothetical protein